MGGMGWYSIAKYRPIQWMGRGDDTSGTWVGLSLWTGVWVAAAKEGLQHEIPIQAPVGSQAGVAVLTHVYQAFTLCTVQHATRLPLRQAVTPGTGCLCHSRSLDHKQQRPLPCPAVCPSPHPKVLGDHTFQKTKV